MPLRVQLDDRQWAKVEAFLRSETGRGRPAFDDRRFVEAVLWILRTGAPWRDLPGEFGPWKTVFNRFDRWSKSGKWQRLLKQLQVGVDPEWFSLDATIVRAHQHAAGAKGGPEGQGIGRSRGGFSTKIHLIVDALGSPLEFAITEGQRHDTVPAPELIARCAPRCLIADKAYDSNALRAQLAAMGSVAVIPSNASRIPALPYDRHLYKERFAIECAFNLLKNARRFATRYEKTLRNYAAIVALACARCWLRF
ncbi:IS5 family transposase [Sorangium sp. So ce1153]|uniref:IS5 family transposase n=1 Tax=Sorangium sp. So ce1153 TaxID=3133333 RepID=UPI003F5F010D